MAREIVDDSAPAQTVAAMPLTRTNFYEQYQALLGLQLGDIVTLPDQREVTVRSIERSLAQPVGTMAGFVLAGEIGPQATLLSIPTNPDGQVLLYSPLENIPSRCKDARCVVEGAVSYWSPHLPNLSGAMGELTYRVFDIRGSIAPMVLVWRSGERVVFVQSAVATFAQLRFDYLGRDLGKTEVAQERHASRVLNPDVAWDEVPAREEERAGSRIRTLVGR